MTIEPHPLAEIFPLMEGAPFDELAGDIAENGLIEKIVLHEGKILDGRNRFNACVKAEVFDADVSPRLGKFFVSFDSHFTRDVVDKGPLAFVLAKNLKRRHLDESQRAMVAARLANLGPGNPANLPGSMSQDEAAKSLNISTRSLRTAKAVQNSGVPELVHAVEQGKLAVSVAARAAKLAPDVQREIVEEVDRGRANVVRTVVKRRAREAREVDLGQKQRALPKKKYGVILADPEWTFETRSEAGLDRAADNHYPTSPVDVIASRPVADIAADDCVVFVWVTRPMLMHGFTVLASWGFVYRTCLVWRKERPGDQRGTGFWVSDEDEIVLLGTRGNPPAPALGDQWRSGFDAPVGQHSEKPDYIHRLIEAYFPTLPKIELNARTARDGWDCWGLEAPVAEAAE